MSSTEESKARVDGPIICPGHSRPVPDIAYSNVTPHGYFLISSCLDGKAMLREGPSGDWIGTFMGHKGAVWCARLNADVTLAVTASADFTAKLWDAVTGENTQTFVHKHIVKAAVFSNDSSNLYTGGMEKVMRIYDLAKPEADPLMLSGHEDTIGGIIALEDPNLVVSHASEKFVRIWDKRTLKTERKLETSDPMTKMTLSNDGSTISTASGKVVTFWDAKTFEKIKSFTMERSIGCVAHHPAVKRFVTGSGEGGNELWVRVYDSETGKEIACNKGHHGPVCSVAFNPDGDNYASGSVDGTIRIWQ